LKRPSFFAENGTAADSEEVKIELNDTKPAKETKEGEPKEGETKEEVPILELPGEASEDGSASTDEKKLEDSKPEKGWFGLFTLMYNLPLHVPLDTQLLQENLHGLLPPS